MKSMRETILAIIPAGQDKELLPAVRSGLDGNYVITKTLSDRRSIDDEKLTKVLQVLGLYVEACKTVPDHERVAKMIEEGRFSQEHLARCMTDPPENADENGMTVSLSVKFEPLK